MKKIIINLLATLFIVSLVSCTEDLNVNNDSALKANTVLDIESVNNDLETIAFAVHRALKSDEFRETLQIAINEKFDGDYNVLFKDFNQKSINSKQSKEIFNEIFTQMNVDSKLLENVYERNRVQIAFPVDFLKWNAKTEIPVVAWKPIDFDEKQTVSIKGFDPEGYDVSIDVKRNPEIPVIVISINERTDIDGNLKSEYFIPSANSNNLSIDGQMTDKDSYTKSVQETAPSNLEGSVAWAGKIVLTWTDNTTNESLFYIERGQGGSFSIIGITGSNVNSFTSQFTIYGSPFQFRVRAKCGTTWTPYSNMLTKYYSTRDARNTEYLTHMKYTDLSEYESWINGAPETRVIVANGSETILLNGVYEPSKRRDIDDVKWNCNINIDSWNPDIHGQALTYKFFEEDWSSTTTSTTIPSYNDDGQKISDLTVSNTSSSKQEIGTRIVWWYTSESVDLGVGSGFVFNTASVGSY